MYSNIKQYAIIETKDRRVLLVLEYDTSPPSWGVLEFSLNGLRLTGIIKTHRTVKTGHYKPFISKCITLIGYALYSGLYAFCEPMTQTVLDAIFAAYVNDLATGKLDNLQLVIGDTDGNQEANRSATTNS